MTGETFRKFLESEAKKNPLKIEGHVDKAEVLRDAKNLSSRISSDDYGTIKRSWQKRSYASIAFVLKKYGLEFKGITYMESLVNEFFRLMEQKAECQ